jgi:hypothetical protein
MAISLSGNDRSALDGYVVADRTSPEADFASFDEQASGSRNLPAGRRPARSPGDAAPGRCGLRAAFVFCAFTSTQGHGVFDAWLRIWTRLGVCCIARGPGGCACERCGAAAWISQLVSPAVPVGKHLAQHRLQAVPGHGSQRAYDHDRRALAGCRAPRCGHGLRGQVAESLLRAVSLRSGGGRPGDYARRDLVSSGRAA